MCVLHGIGLFLGFYNAKRVMASPPPLIHAGRGGYRLAEHLRMDRATVGISAAITQ